MGTEAARQERIDAIGFDFSAQESSEVWVCNLCGGEQLSTLTHRDRYGYPIRACLCVRCGLVFLTPRMSAGAYGDFYRSVYRPLVSAYHGHRIDELTVQAEQRVYAAEIADFISRWARPARGRLLDIGGSTGVVAKRLCEELEMKGTIVDPAPMEVDVARKLGLDAVEAMIEDYTTRERFDLIVMCQTIDHLLDVSAGLEKARQLLAEDGYFFVDIVDLRAVFLRNRSIEEAIKVDHPYYFVDETFEAHLHRNGLDPLATEFSPDGIHIRYLCQPSAPTGDLPDMSLHVRALMNEIRYVQSSYDGSK